MKNQSSNQSNGQSKNQSNKKTPRNFNPIKEDVVINPNGSIRAEWSRGAQILEGRTIRSYSRSQSNLGDPTEKSYASVRAAQVAFGVHRLKKVGVELAV